MSVTLRHFTPLEVCVYSIRTCWQSFDKSDNCGEKDRALVDRISNKLKHSSTLEHLNYNFYIQGISRACLQELARHRMSSFSVKSTRYTLGELKKEQSFLDPNDENFMRAEKFIVLVGNEAVDLASLKALEGLRELIASGVRLDLAKYALPESYKTELSWSVNARSLQNFLSLRSGKTALWEIQDLAHAIFCSIPQDHKMLFEHCINHENTTN
ncbi:MAG: FAD-dependent thymidylate synthase [Helicobacter sp.]|nr:FAD-dependent thymidylate synthase [Helicobacter sp.]